MGAMDMAFGIFDYLGDLTKFITFHRSIPMGMGPARGEVPGQIRFVFYALIIIIVTVIFFLEIVYRSVAEHS